MYTPCSGRFPTSFKKIISFHSPASLFALSKRHFVLARSKVRPRTGTKNIRAYCLLEGGPHHYSGRRLPCCFGFTWGLVEFRKMLWGLPPIYFGKEDGVERTLLRVACQSETFLAPPWQGGIDIRVLWHIGCQSEFNKLQKCLPVR